MDRRSFVKYLLAAPAIAYVGAVGSNKAVAESQKMPKAIVVDPFLVSVNDLRKLKDLGPGKIEVVRLRRPAWGTGDPIRKIY